METANHSIGLSGDGSNDQKHVTTLSVGGGGNAAVSSVGEKREPGAGFTSEIITTPTEAAAAGDINIDISDQVQEVQDDYTYAQVDKSKAKYITEVTDKVPEEVKTEVTEKVSEVKSEVKEEVSEVKTEVKEEVKDISGEMGNSRSTHGEMVTMTSVKKIEPVDTMPAHSLGKKDLDDVFPANSLICTTAGGTVKLRLADTGDGAIRPVTIPTVFYNTVKRIPNNVALAVKRGGVWKKWSYEQYYVSSKKAAKAFIKLGLEPHHGLGILGFNSPEWFICYMGGIFAGGMSTGIYTTNSPEACHYVLEDCKANIIVVENNVQLQKIIKVWDRLPNLKAVVQYSGEVAERRPDVLSWEEFMALADVVPDEKLEERLALQAPNTCASLIYTSGTTGNPKAVMISHDNLTWTAGRAASQLKMTFGQEVFVTFLPLSHIAAQMLDIIIPLQLGVAVYFAQPDALKGTLGDTWKEVRPTSVLAVPRVWEKLMEKLVAAGKQAPSFRKKIVAWAKVKGLKGTYAKTNGESLPFGWSMANLLVFKKVRGLMGLDRCQLFGSAAAPITKETLDFFAALNIRLDECYGMSESTGPHTFCTPDACRITSVGKELSGVQTKIDKPDEDGNGEVCMYGRHVFMGYLNQEEKTNECIDREGWLHSGDVGKKDNNGFLYITGRIKELIITAGGENIAPVPIEDTVKENLPCISNCMLIGDKRKFLSMLLTLKTEVDIDTMEPKDKLMDVTLEWCRSINSSVTTVNEALSDSNVLKAIQAGIDKTNKKAVSNAQRIQKWSILPKDFSLPGGELGPTLKLRRPIVVKMYEKTISAFYEEQ